MITDWVQQEVVHHIGWRSRFCQTVTSEAVLPAEHTALNVLLADTDSAFKHDQTTTVTKLQQDSQSLVLKRYNPRSQLHKIKRAFRMSRAKRCWNMSYAFARAGLKVAPPVLMYEHRFGPIRLNAYFANQFLAGQELLTALPLMTEQERAHVVLAINRAFEKMRVAKLTHGDMKASNLMWVDGDLFFIDLDAATQHRSMLSWRKSHAKDRKRFLKNWQDQPELFELFKNIV